MTEEKHVAFQSRNFGDLTGQIQIKPLDRITEKCVYVKRGYWTERYLKSQVRYRVFLNKSEAELWVDKVNRETGVKDATRAHEKAQQAQMDAYNNLRDAWKLCIDAWDNQEENTNG